ncbi:MAG: [FeFe] hydrogenase H-cluster maturation GTPase HydF [Anaerococcus sp.]|nr:[FeFe] hydrogenase H-cluster maturation GTPase HydF [Anaerococcus sp.]
MKSQNSEKIHIGIFGDTNSGKSTLLNYMTGTKTSIVSPISGTTTDPIRKAMEITDFGPVLFIDTAGFNDKTDLGKLRVQKSLGIIDKCDIFIYCLSENLDKEIIEKINLSKKPIIYVAMRDDLDLAGPLVEKYKDLDPIAVDVTENACRLKIFDRIKKLYKKEELSITGSLVKEGDMVILVIPQDKAAPKGRLIKPQVMTIRELIDKNATALACKLENLENTLKALKDKPDLVICDSQVFKESKEILGDGIRLTSFSVLFSAYKGDIDYFVESVKVLEREVKNILISEACTHPPIDEDIGTVKIPKMLRERFPDISIDFNRGDDPIAYEKYDLIINCGACMFNRTSMLSKVGKAKAKKVPMTNYGITIAYLKGILDKITLP